MPTRYGRVLVYEGIGAMTDLVLTVDEAAAALGLHRQSVYAAIRNGELPAVRVGRKILVPREALERYLTERALASATGR